jgi:hypothetical protein
MEKLYYDRPSIIQAGITLNQSRFLNLFWTGFITYSVGFTIGTTGIISLPAAQLLQVVGLLLFIPSSFGVIKYQLDNNYLKLIFPLYLLWMLITVWRGLSFDYASIKTTLFEPYNGVFLYLTPLILLLPREPVHYKKLFLAIVYLSIVYLLYDLVFIKKLVQSGSSSRTMLEYFAKTLGIPAGYLLVTYVYHSRKATLIAALAIFITLLLAIIGARRGLMFMTGTIILFAFLMYCYENRHRFINVVLSAFAVLLVCLYAATMFYSDDIKLFNFAKERMDEDTRSTVELFFYDDMQKKDWLIGRGMNGLVASPVSLKEDHVGGKPGYRDGIETDYLKIILKGGIISLGLLLLIAVPAVFLGLFFSTNLLAKAAALWIVLWMLSLYPTNVTNFTLNYLLVWVSIGICYSKNMRYMPEAELRNILRG